MADDQHSINLTFLYKIIDDNQATIRFLDTKAAFGIAVLGAIIGRVLDRDQIIACTTHGAVLLTASLIFALLILTSAVLGYRTVFPTVNPAQNVSFPDNLDPKFFLSSLKPRRWQRLFSSSKKYAMLQATHAEYCASLQQASAQALESIAAAEALKLSFIRQLKTDRLTAMAKALTLTVLLFILVTLWVPKAVDQKTAPPAKPPNTQGTYLRPTNNADSRPATDKSAPTAQPTQAAPAYNPQIQRKHLNSKKRKPATNS